MICENCKTKMVYKIIDRTQGWYCPNCNNAIVTSYFTKIELDNTNYEVLLLANNETNIESIKLISKLTGLNFIKSNELLLHGGLLIRGLARDINEIIKMLKENNVLYKIEPKYDYE